MLRLTSGLALAMLVAVTSQSAWAQKAPSINVRETISRMDRDLQSDFAKAGLESSVRALFVARRRIKPLGYEDKPQFTQQFDSAYEAFQAGLWKGELREYQQRMLKDERLLSMLEQRLRENGEKFGRFRLDLVAGSAPIPPYLKSAPADYLLRAQLYFAVILNGVNANAFSGWIKETAIWPFC